MVIGLLLAAATLLPGTNALLTVRCSERGALAENFRSWSKGRAKESVVQDDGRRFFRIESDASQGVVQYCTHSILGEVDGFYRLRVRARNRGDGFMVWIRQDAPPYKAVATAQFSAPDWQEREYFLQVSEKLEGTFSLYLIFGTGSYDLDSLSLEKLDRQALVSRYRRPPEGVTELLTPTAFPLGLPQGWTIGSQCCRATAGEKDGNLIFRSNGDSPAKLFSAPFQTNRPDAMHRLNLVYRSKGRWSAQFIADRENVMGGAVQIPATNGFAVFEAPLWINGLSSSVTVRFSGEGELELKEIHVVSERASAAANPVVAAIRFRGGEVGDATRTVFEGESPVFEWKVLNADPDDRIVFTMGDSYGRERVVREEGVADGSGALKGISLSELGAYRLSLEVRGREGGKRAATECVFICIGRPKGWGRDLPDSPFGIHVAPREDHVRLAKACGMNWVRLHDAGTECTGWWALEAEKGKWTFHDDLVDVYRRNGMKILAQLGTSPAWASHFHDLGYKRMDYFAKYLRPTNIVAYVDYVTKVVSRYRGQIDEYFFWNEPWGGWWATAADIKYYDRSRGAEDYAAFQRITYDAIKAVDPSIRFVGLNSNAFDTGYEWSERVARSGGWEACDAIDYHYYTGNLRATRTSYNTIRKAFGALADEHPGFDGKPVYMTEGSGHNNGSCRTRDFAPVSGLYRELVPWAPETTETWTRRADRNARFALSMLSDGNARMFLYGIHCHMALGIPPSFAILVGADGGPSPECAAFSQFTRVVEGRKFVAWENYGEIGLVFTFEGGPGRVKIYADLTRAEAEALPKDGLSRDLYGNPLDLSRWLPGTLIYR